MNRSMVLDIIDWYHKASILTRDKDLEQEAIANSRLGYVYDKVEINRTRAKETYHYAVQLAHAMHPRTFNDQAWFREATAVLKRFQDEKVAEEEMKWSNQRHKFVKEAEKEIAMIETQFKKNDNIKFLKFLYSKFKPKNTDHKMGNIKTSTEKSLLKKALVHYHPDKQAEHGEKWFVICEEICKLLTQKYERMKI